MARVPGSPLKRAIVTTDRVPPPTKPIALGIRFGNLVFTSGVNARDPATGELLDQQRDMEEVARVALDSIRAIVEAGGSSLDHLVHLRCFLRDVDKDLDAWNRVYQEYFPEHWPARTVIPAPLGPGYRIELEAVACIPDE
jgi:2-iminobutanoate/2-iminopropanoate deaminase